MPFTDYLDSTYVLTDEFGNIIVDECGDSTGDIEYCPIYECECTYCEGCL